MNRRRFLTIIAACGGGLAARAGVEPRVNGHGAALGFRRDHRLDHPDPEAVSIAPRAAPKLIRWRGCSAFIALTARWRG